MTQLREQRQKLEGHATDRLGGQSPGPGEFQPASAPAATPLAPQIAAPAPKTEAQPAAPTVGTVTVDGPVGAAVFDGDQKMGVAPITFTTSLGSHQLRIEDGKQKTSTTIQVTDKAVSNVHVEFAKRGRGRLVRRAGGGVVAPADNGSKDDANAKSGSGGPSQADMKAAEDDLRKAKDSNSLGGGT